MAELYLHSPTRFHGVAINYSWGQFYLYFSNSIIIIIIIVIIIIIIMRVLLSISQADLAIYMSLICSHRKLKRN
jgi:hypothetical protein